MKKDPLAFSNMFPQPKRTSRNDPLSLSNMIGNQRPWKMNFNIDLSNPAYYPNPYRTQRPARRPSKPQSRFTRRVQQPTQRPRSYYVATEINGVQRVHPFTDRNRAKAFRERYKAAGVYDQVSDVVER